MTINAAESKPAQVGGGEEVKTGDGSHAWKEVLKSPKAHERTIVGLRVFQDARTRQMTLATLAHDSLKLWSVNAFEDDFSLFPLRTIGTWNCGVQSFTASGDGKALSLVSMDCSLHHIHLGDTDEEEPRLETVQKGLMEMWFVQAVQPGQFLTVNFQAGQLQMLDAAGTITQAAQFERTRQVSALSYSERFIAVGTSQGVIFLASPSTLNTLYSTEAHAMKVRCLEFLPDFARGEGDEPAEQVLDEVKLLSGSDDKTIKLFSLSESGARLQRLFCGHKAIVTGLAICHASRGQRFASAGADSCLIIWAMDSGAKLVVIPRCTGTALNDLPRSVCFTPNGRFLLAGTEEATLLAFRVAQPENYVEPAIQEEEEEAMDVGDEPGLVVGEYEEEEENDENRMEGEGDEHGELEQYSPQGLAGEGEEEHFPAYGNVSPSPSDDDELPPPHEAGQEQNEQEENQEEQQQQQQEQSSSELGEEGQEDHGQQQQQQSAQHLHLPAHLVTWEEGSGSNSSSREGSPQAQDAQQEQHGQAGAERAGDEHAEEEEEEHLSME